MSDEITQEDLMAFAEMVESELEGSYELVYVDYRDELSDDQVTMLLAGDREGFYDSTSEWEGDQRWDRACDIVDELASDIASREYEDPDGVLAEFQLSDERYSLIELVQERDDSDWEARLINNTSAPIMRAQLDLPSAEGDGNLPYGWIPENSNAALARELGCYHLDNVEAVTELAVELDWPDYYWAFLVFRPTDLKGLIYAEPDDVVVITSPNIWLTNIYQGNGHMVEVTGEYRVKRSDIMTDDSAPGYSADEVMGLAHSAMDADIRIEYKREVKVA